MSLVTSSPTGKYFMSDMLNKTIVLVLNRNWQAINIRTPADAFCQMATNAATAPEIELGDGARTLPRFPGRMDCSLPVRTGDHAVRTARRGDPRAHRHRGRELRPRAYSA